MKIDNVGGREYWTITHPDDLLAWNVVFAEPFKEGVKRLHVTNAALPSEFRVVYCTDKILDEQKRLQMGDLGSEFILDDILDAEVIG